MMLSWRVPHLRRGSPKKQTQAPIPVETEAAPIEEPTKEFTPAEILAEDAAPLEEPTKEMASAVAPMEDAAPMEEPDEELATLMAITSGPTEEPSVPPYPVRRKKRGRCLIATIMAGWRCCTPLRP